MIQLILYACVLLTMLDRKTVGLTTSICASVPDRSFVRSSQSCESYNRCVNGVPHHGVCPNGIAFSPLNQMCETNTNVDCRACSPFGIQHIANPDHCQLYYRCVNGVRTSMICPDELRFDPSFGDCNVASRVKCDTKNYICRPYISFGLIIITNPLNCSSYYRCMNGIAIEVACPSGLFYNPQTSACELFGNFCLGP